jgi:3'-5' exoribonuclease
MTPTQKLFIIAGKLDVVEISNYVLDDWRFPIWSGSSKPYKHHYGKGGLAQHVLEVCELCLQNNEYFCTDTMVDSKKLFLAALFHDAGKMWDYKPIDVFNKDWMAVDHKFLIHHISRSAILWSEASTKCKWKQEDIDEVLHCILSHHGQKEWGSPVTPQTRMAWLLHLCDGISARIDDCVKRPLK